MQKAKLPPEDIQMLQQLMAGYEQFVQALQGGGEEEPQGPQGSQGSTPMETGGKPSQPAL